MSDTLWVLEIFHLFCRKHSTFLQFWDSSKMLPSFASWSLNRPIWKGWHQPEKACKQFSSAATHPENKRHVPAMRPHFHRLFITILLSKLHTPTTPNEPQKSAAWEESATLGAIIILRDYQPPHHACEKLKIAYLDLSPLQALPSIAERL